MKQQVLSDAEAYIDSFLSDKRKSSSLLIMTIPEELQFQNQPIGDSIDKQEVSKKLQIVTNELHQIRLKRDSNQSKTGSFDSFRSESKSKQHEDSPPGLSGSAKP